MNFLTFLSTVYFITPSNKCHFTWQSFADFLTDFFKFIFHFQILEEARDVYWIGETTSDVHISKRVSTIDYFDSIHKSGSYSETCSGPYQTSKVVNTLLLSHECFVDVL